MTYLPKPEWLKKRIPNKRSIEEMEALFRGLSLHTVCEEANCPNAGECFTSRTATFMILGDTCTRNCRFCAVKKGEPFFLDPNEPEHVAEAAQRLALKHIVVTSVTRDDLPDGGASHFAQVTKSLRKACPTSTIELLIPDLQGNWEALEIIVNEHPDVLNHNVETVPSLYPLVRPQAKYERSIELLRRVKGIDSSIITKSGLMVGLGEQIDEVASVMDDLIGAGCDMLTIGQYLQPSLAHLPIAEYVTPEQFERYKKIALEKGFPFVAAGPFVRSSYHAHKGITQLQFMTSEEVR